MCTHTHFGPPHTAGDDDSQCRPVCTGRITYCGPHVDDPFREDNFCEHEDTRSQPGTALNIPAGSVTHRIGTPGAWSRNRRIPGNNPGLYRSRLISNRYYDQSPFHTQNIPCNPDAPGTVAVSETVSRTVKLSVVVGAKIKAVIDAKVGFDISTTRSMTCATTLRGERCRSVDYAFFVRYELWEMSVFPPDTVSVGRYTIRFFVPIGWHVSKEYVQPTCCQVRTSGVFRSLDGMLEGTGGERRLALAGAADDMRAASGLIVDPRDHSALVETYGAALVKLAATDLGSYAAAEEPPAEVLHDLVDDLVGETVRTAVDAGLRADDASILPPTYFEAAMQAKEALEVARSSADVEKKASAYTQAYDLAMMLDRITADTMVALEISKLPELDLE